MNSKTKRKDSGFKFPYKKERLSLSEITKKAGCSPSMTHKCLRDLNEDPVRFVARMKRKKLLKKGKA